MWDLVRYDDWYLKLLLSQEAISCPYYKFIKRLLCYNTTPPICYLWFTCCTCWEVSGCPEKIVYNCNRGIHLSETHGTDIFDLTTNAKRPRASFNYDCWVLLMIVLESKDDMYASKYAKHTTISIMSSFLLAYLQWIVIWTL